MLVSLPEILAAIAGAGAPSLPAVVATPQAATSAATSSAAAAAHATAAASLAPAAAVPAAAAVPQSTASLSPTLQAQLQNYANGGPKTPLALHYPWLTHIFATVFVLSAVLLVVLLAIQTTKQEGLNGTLGGRGDGNSRPRLGFDQQLARITSFFAIVFVISATFVSLSGI